MYYKCFRSNPVALSTALSRISDKTEAFEEQGGTGPCNFPLYTVYYPVWSCLQLARMQNEEYSYDHGKNISKASFIHTAVEV
jgi:hypothetical protein